MRMIQRQKTPEEIHPRPHTHTPIADDGSEGSAVLEPARARAHAAVSRVLGLTKPQTA